MEVDRPPALAGPAGDRGPRRAGTEDRDRERSGHRRRGLDSARRRPQPPPSGTPPCTLQRAKTNSAAPAPKIFCHHCPPLLAVLAPSNPAEPPDRCPGTTAGTAEHVYALLPHTRLLRRPSDPLPFAIPVLTFAGQHDRLRAAPWRRPLLTQRYDGARRCHAGSAGATRGSSGEEGGGTGVRGGHGASRVHWPGISLCEGDGEVPGPVSPRLPPGSADRPLHEHHC